VLLVIVEDKPAMDLVGADNHLAVETDTGKPQKLITGEDASGGVLRVAEDEHPGPLGDRVLYAAEVKDIPGTVDRMGHRDKCSLREDRRDEKGRIGRDGGHYRVACFPYGSAGDVQPGHETRQPDDPLGFYHPCMHAFKHVQNSLKEVVGWEGVTEDTVLDVPVERGNNGRRGLEVHIRHPQGKDILPFVLVPLEACGIAALYRNTKIKGHIGRFCHGIVTYGVFSGAVKVNPLTDIIKEKSLFLQEPLTVGTYLHTAFFRIPMGIVHAMFFLAPDAAVALRALVKDFILVAVRVAQARYPLM